MERIVEQRGRYILRQEEQGYAWTMTTEGGQRWYYHPEKREWTLHPLASCTPAEATAGFDPDSTQNDTNVLATAPAAANCRESVEGGIVMDGTTGQAAPTANGPAAKGR